MNKSILSVVLMGLLPFATNSTLAAALSHVAHANQKAPGMSAPNVLAPELIEVVRAQGSTPLENPSDTSGHYGYRNDGPMLPVPGDLPSKDRKVEASKTEPDKNTYLVLKDQVGSDPKYDYGTHFLFQGHEIGGIGYITRINLDADSSHRITLLAEKDVKGVPLPNFDGSTWDPWAKRLLLTAELGNKGGVWQSTLDGQVEDISGALGRAGYEGIQNDGDGNLWLIEDVGGKNGTQYKNARQPNSFVYRFVPKDPSDLTRGGKLQALAVSSLRHSGAIVFNNAAPDNDIKSDDIKDLHTYGEGVATTWVTIHDTDIDGQTAFDANALAKGKATPFKRPENGVFRPGTRFTEFYFSETGDTNLSTQAGSEFGGFGAVMKLIQSSPSSNSGTLSLVYLGNSEHTGFDNLAFWSKQKLIVVEDAGDTVHTQRNALDSAYLLDVQAQYGDGKKQPIRILAQGRDASATLDSGFAGIPDSGFQNDGDNEITGIHVSDGDASVKGVLGAKAPKLFKEGWRAFYTQQHGDNVTYELLPSRCGESYDSRKK